MRLFVLMTTLIVAGMSCKKEDADKPVIVSVYTNGLVDEHLHGTSDFNNVFEISVADNEALSQVMLQMITPPGFHSHDEVADELSISERTFQSPNLGQWDATVIHNISGAAITNRISVQAPPTVSGGWLARVSVLDQGGNITQKDYTLHVYNTDRPMILPDSTLPISNREGIVELASNESLALYGYIVDFDTLQQVQAVLLDASLDTVQNQLYASINNWTYSMQNILLDPIAEAGSYYLHLRALDRLGWDNWRRIRIEVSE